MKRVEKTDPKLAKKQDQDKLKKKTQTPPKTGEKNKAQEKR